MFHAGGWKDRSGQTDIVKLRVAIRNFAKGPK